MFLYNTFIFHLTHKKYLPFPLDYESFCSIPAFVAKSKYKTEIGDKHYAYQ